MPRPTKFRRVEFLPEVTVFKPAGVPLRALEEVVLTVEELEALRLKDLEDLEQEQCAERMQVSRPTFQRVLESARRKVAEALTQGKAVRIEGGTYRVAMRRFRCPNCEQEFEEPYGTGRCGMDMTCPRCGAPRVYRVDGDTPRDPSLPGPDERPHGWHGRGRGFWGPPGPRGPQEKA